MLVIKRSEKSEIITELLHSYFNKTAVSCGGVETKEGILAYFSDFPQVFFNMVSSCSETSNILNVAAILEGAIARANPFVWMTHASNHTALRYLEDQGLLKRGMLTGMLFDLSASWPTYQSHPAMQLIHVQTIEEFYEWSYVFSECYQIPSDQVEAYFKAGLGEDRQFDLYLVCIYQKAIACSVMVIEDERALFLWDSVLPMYRRQGVGGLMVLSRLMRARELGCKEAYAFALEASLAMYRSLGFRSFGRFPIMRYVNNTSDIQDDG